ncbi:F-box/FBD/LRR-repeat protein At4g26340-like [Lotus japonicus]|uniref:F-box/FBD/LRR-repeat protein At4g26340-like n=1 Tax=Lotus japonicus TaxID=34305 RepID=UPI002587572F|nr:F-box/FBD/LRR-repeat protein At4g26340-like [Lotus japonicus]
MADNISMLPDDVACRILSFLPTQDVVATSLLAKRWLRLWLSVPSLYFDDRSFLTNKKPYDRFKKFIYAIIFTRGAHRPLKSFFLQCRSSKFDISESDLNIWVELVIKFKLEDLQIKLRVISELNLRSHRIFTCNSLVILKLAGLKLDVFSSVDLPLLKTIYLDDIIFPGWQYVVQLLSGCPIVENMHVKFIGSLDDPPYSNENFKILSKLVRADIREVVEDIPLKAICNVEFLRIDKYTDDVPFFPNLTHLELICGCGMNWNMVLEMLKKCPKLQTFVINLRTCYTSAVWTLPNFVPECLSSQLRKFSIKCCKGTEGELHFVKYIMQNARVLGAMTIGIWYSIRIERKFEILQELSLCPRSSLICELSFK